MYHISARPCAQERGGKHSRYALCDRLADRAVRFLPRKRQLVLAHGRLVDQQRRVHPKLAKAGRRCCVARETDDIRVNTQSSYTATGY